MLAQAAASGSRVWLANRMRPVEGEAEDFVYLDPPYWKLGGYSDFNRYTPGQFREADHVRLTACCRELDLRGIRWAVSNSDTEFVAELFQGYRIVRLENRREINLNSGDRDITELLIMNFADPCRAYTAEQASGLTAKRGRP